MSAIKGVNHIGLSVTNIDRTIAFYRDLLGMDVVVEPTPFGGERYEKIMKIDGAKGRVAVVKKGSLALELFEFSAPSPKAKDPKYPVSDRGISHFCVEVSDIKEIYERLRAADVPLHCPPLDFGGKAWATYARDPDGNVFELLELVTGASRS